MISHNPFVTGLDCNYAGEIYPAFRGPVYIQSKCGLDSVITLLDGLKREGIYDKSTIVLIYGRKLRSNNSIHTYVSHKYGNNKYICHTPLP